MPEILTQSQIDALLKGINSGEVSTDDKDKNEKKIREYDFNSPKKFTKEQLRTMDSLHENLSRLLSNYFSGILRVFSEVSVLQVEEQSYYEFNNALPDNTLIGLIDMQPKIRNMNESTMMVDMSTNIGFFMIDRLLGGSGDGYALTRDFTEIEIAILTSAYQRLTGYIQDSWCDYIEVSCSLDSIETNPRLLQVYAPEDIVIIVVLSVKLREVEGTITICIPGMGLEEMLGDFTSKYTRINKKFSDENREAIRKQVIENSLYGSDLNVKAIFAQTQLELADIMRLRVNDVIPLPKHVNGNSNGNINLFVDDVPWFSGKLGVTKSKKAVKITGIYKH